MKYLDCRFVLYAYVLKDDHFAALKTELIDPITMNVAHNYRHLCVILHTCVATDI